MFKEILAILVLFIGLASSAQNKGQTVVDTPVIELNTEDQEYFRKETMKRINDFQAQLSFIADKKYDADAKAVYKEIALSNFINNGKGVVMEVSFVSPVTEAESRKRKPLIGYLDDLCNLPYTRIELRKAKSCYVSNLIKAGYDKNANPVYRATATYYQEFIGYSEGGVPVYHDITQKTVEIIVSYTTNIGKQQWVVQLGDIAVFETTT
ncbi:MAG: hypothetical protein AB2L20_12400 [Mangrovibacterium sp.]